MKQWATLRNSLSNKSELIYGLTDLALPLFVSMLWYTWLSSRGIAMSPDSTHYLYNSLEVVYSFGFTTFRAVWPPAYPVFLALAQLINPSPTAAASIVSAVSLFVGLFLLNNILKLFLVSAVFRYSAILLLFLNPRYLIIYHYAWTEGPFTALTLVFLYFLLKHTKNHKVGFLWAAAIAASGMALTRYLGYYAFITLFIYIIIFNYVKKEITFKTISQQVAIMLVAVVPSVLWLARNYLTDGTFHGPRNPSPYSVFENLWLYLTCNRADLWPLVVSFIFIAPIIPIGLMERFKAQKSEDIKNTFAFAIVILSAYFIYIALTIYSSSTAHFDRLSTRFFAPTYPLIIIVYIHILFTAVNRDRLKRYLAKYSLLIVLLYSLLFLFRPYFTFDYTGSKRHHTWLGFSKSETREQLGSWLMVAIENDPEALKLIVFADDHRLRPHRSRALLYRTEIFEDYELNKYRVGNGDLELLLMGPFKNITKIYFVGYHSPDDIHWEEIPRNHAILVDDKGLELLQGSGFTAQDYSYSDFKNYHGFLPFE